MHDPDIALPTSKTSRGLRTTGRICASAAAIAFILLLSIGALGLYLQRNSVSADFIRERLVHSLQREFGGAAVVDIGEVRLGGGQGYLATQVLGLVVRSPKGEPILSAPDARIDLSPTALTRFELVAQRIVFDKVDLAIDIAPDGGVSIANMGGSASAARPAAEVAAAILAVMNGTMGVGGAPIPTVELENGRLAVHDRRRNRHFALDHVRVSADPIEGGRPAIHVSGDTPGGPMALRIAPGTEPLSFDVSVDRVSPADVSALVGDDLKFVSPTLPVSLNFTVRFDEQAVPQHVTGDIRFGHGFLYIDDPDAKPIELTHARVKFDYQAATSSVAISELAFDAGGVNVALSGSIAAVDASLDAWRLQLSGAGGNIKPLTDKDAPVIIARQSVEALLYPKQRKVVISRLDLSGNNFSAAAAAEANFDERGRMALKVGLGLGRTDGRVALHLWPSFVAPELRNFLIVNLRSGILNKLTVSTDISIETFDRMKARKPMPDASVTADFAISDAVLQLVPGLSPLSGASFDGHATGLTANLANINAAITLPSGKSLAMSEGTFAIADLGRKPVEASSQFRVVAPAEAVLEFVAQPALQGVLPSNGKSDGVKGLFDGQVSVALPLIDKIGPSDVGVQIKAVLNNVVAEHFFGKDKFEAPQMQLSSQAGVMTLKGEGKVAGMAATVDVVQPRKNDAEDAIVTLVLDDASRTKRGFNLGTQLTGPVSVKIKSDFPVNTKAGIPVEIDLTKAAIDGLLPGWVKPAGKAARAKFVLNEKESGYRLTSLDLDGAGPSVKGALDILADGTINAFQLSSVKLSPGDNVQIDGQRTPNGMKLTVRGNSFDARPFLRGSPKGANKADTKELELDLKVVALGGFNGEIASNGEVKLLKKGQQIRQGSITGRLNGDALTGKFVPNADGTSLLNLQSDNAGSLLRFMDIYNHMQGGHLSAQVSLVGPREKGWFLIRNFELRDEPALQRVAAAAVAPDNNANPQRQSIVSDSSDVSFQRMRVDFSRNGDVFTVNEGVMWGREVGGTIHGQMDYGRDKIDFSGTFVPAYGLNNAFSKIPVFGFLLTGDKNEGLFAVPFRITGKASSPSLSVNPIAAVSPGFLRKIFDFQAQPAAEVDALPE